MGGSYFSTLSLIENLDKEKYFPIIVVHQRGPFTDYLDDRKIDYHLLKLPCFVGEGKGLVAHMVAIAKTFFIIKKFLFQLKVDLVHLNESPVNQTWICPCKWGMKIPTIWHQRDECSTSRLDLLQLFLTQKIIAISQFVFNSLPTVHQKNTIVVNNPIETPPVSKNVKKDLRKTLKLPLKDKKPIIGFFGRFVAYKRPESVIDLAKSLDGAHIVMYGADVDGVRTVIEQKAKEQNFNDRIHIFDFQPLIETRIAGCDVVFAPAVGEGFGRVLVEASLLGVPVVAANAGGHQEIVEHGKTGFLFKPDDFLEAAEYIQSLIKDKKLYDNIAKAAKLSAQERFNIQAHNNQIVSVYEEVLLK
jgi:glycosyltransferase involved in cell wall biosynthesis